MPALIATLVMLLVASTTSVASDDVKDKVRAYVDNIGTQVMDTVADEALDSDAKRTALEDTFAKTVDIDWIGKFVLGRHWRAMDDAQREEYMLHYRAQLIDSYVSKFEQYEEGTRFKVLRIIPEIEDEYLVAMKIFRGSGKPPVMAEYRVRDYGAETGFKVFDIIVEGASLISAQRSEYTSLVGSRGMEYLITQLAAKTAEEVAP